MLKKTISLLLAALAICAAWPVHAAPVKEAVRQKVGGINAGGFDAALEAVASNGGIEADFGDMDSADGLTDITARPGDTVTIELTADMFLNADGEAFPDDAPIAYSAISSDIRLERRGKGGKAAEFSLAGDSRGSRVEIAFAKSIAYIGDEFDYEFRLTSRSGRDDSPYIAVTGIFETELERGEDNGSYDVSEGEGVEVSGGAVSDVEFDLGEGVTITRRTLGNGKYYGVVTSVDPLPEDDEIIDKYPAIEYVYRLQTSRLKATGNIVSFDLGGDYHAYNTHGEYLGLTSAPLPYWTTYYMSSERYENLF